MAFITKKLNEVKIHKDSHALFLTSRKSLFVLFINYLKIKNFTNSFQILINYYILISKINDFNSAMRFLLFIHNINFYQNLVLKEYIESFHELYLKHLYTMQFLSHFYF